MRRQCDLAVTVEPLGELREAISWVGSIGARGVQLDAAQVRAAGALSGSALRDLRASLRRAEVECSGIDLWTTAAHWTDAACVEELLSETAEALNAAEELGRVPVTLALPGPAADAREEAIRRDAIGATVHAAERRGVRLADIGGEGARAAAAARLPRSAGAIDGGVSRVAVATLKDAAGSGPPTWPWPPLGACVDAAALLATGQSPHAVVLALGERMVAARVVDLLRTGMRGPLGQPDGQLDTLEYRMALETTGFRGLPVVDARRWPAVRDGVNRTLEAWARCVPGGT